MDPERARELLAAERARIERALAQLGPEDDGEPEIADVGNLASNTFQQLFRLSVPVLHIFLRR